MLGEVQFQKVLIALEQRFIGIALKGNTMEP
jgi:hypothetical protein